MMDNNYNQSEEFDSSLRDNIGALWKKEDKTGKEYLVGRVKINDTPQEVIAFLNTEKRSDSQPDYLIRKQTGRNKQVRPQNNRPRVSHHKW